MRDLVSCPKCGLPETVLIEEEVDIGVGIQKFVVGWDCDQCGRLIACVSCGAALGTQHNKWCEAGIDRLDNLPGFE